MLIQLNAQLCTYVGYLYAITNTLTSHYYNGSTFQKVQHDLYKCSLSVVMQHCKRVCLQAYPCWVYLQNCTDNQVRFAVMDASHGCILACINMSYEHLQSFSKPLPFPRRHRLHNSLLAARGRTLQPRCCSYSVNADWHRSQYSPYSPG